MNTKAIDKIIKELSFRDYKAAWDKYPKSFIGYYKGIAARKPRGYFPFSYSLGIDTEEALNIKKDYISQAITENEYKAYCLNYNLTSL